MTDAGKDSLRGLARRWRAKTDKFSIWDDAADELETELDELEREAELNKRDAAARPAEAAPGRDE